MVFAAAMDFLQQHVPGLAAGNVVATRFAPSPNGQLHLGHAFSALCAHDFAKAHGGAFQLRIEDIDGTRSRSEHVDTILEDMAWLGLDWDGPVQYQSRNLARYQAALDRLSEQGLLYKCTCTRAQIAEAIAAKPVPHGPDGPIYPGTCRRREADKGAPFSWRLDMAEAVKRLKSPSLPREGLGWVASAASSPAGSHPPPPPPLEGRGELTWTDLAAGEQLADPELFGDIVLWRKDAPASYHLAATVDDAAEGISHVVRGRDLFAYTAVHRLLQALLDLPEPLYWHHPLLLDESGEKLAKSKASSALAGLRIEGGDGHALINALRHGELPLGISLSRA